MLNDAYLAGFVDGEGTIGLRYKKNRRIIKGRGFTIDVNFRIANSNRAILELIQKEIGGAIMSNKQLTTNSKIVYHLEITNAKAILNVLNKIVPYLIIKKEQAELVMKFCDLRSRHTKNDGYSREEIIIANRVITLNKRGLGRYGETYYKMLKKMEQEIINQKNLVPNAT